MKLSDLRKHLHQHNCLLARDTGGHSIYKNTANGKSAAVPRHTEIAWGTVKGICERLEIPKPSGR